ncbi:unnamed protein product [Pseudo-nitzschia multistriata]|uniref:Uncharacterized protein n=1 Tax=Pseudo-nitzschia multistriata TaxID=183589 RepID=A0A448YXR6_9STRA|nr:unnamed protein product [Pseudo-nitzschia multistriata]
MQEQRRSVRYALLAAILIMSAKRALCLHSVPSQEGGSEEEYSSRSTDDMVNNDTSSNSSGAGTTGKIPFVGPLHSFQYQDPFAKGFEITTRVYTDPQDKLAHFDDVLSNDETSSSTPESSLPPTVPIVLPYWECGVSGSTTVPVPLSSLTIRHLLGGSKPGSFEEGCGRGDTVGVGGGIGRGGGSNHDDTHPRLVVPLTSLEIVLNSGQMRIFQPGDVILLENCLTGGHILQGHEGNDMIVMLLTLPHAYHHAGKDRNSLSSIFENNFWKQSPCKTGLVGNNNDRTESRKNIVVPWSRSSRIRRRLGLGIIGAGVSLAMADFLGKVAPLALALAAGGGLVAVGGTYSIIRLGEYGLDELDFWHERRLLKLQGGSSTPVNDGNEKEDKDQDS